MTSISDVCMVFGLLFDTLLFLFFLSCVPYIIAQLCTQKTVILYYYEPELFDYDIHDIGFENNDSIQNQKHSRILAYSGSSIRLENGNILSDENLEQLKSEVYGIELP